MINELSYVNSSRRSLIVGNIFGAENFNSAVKINENREIDKAVSVGRNRNDKPERVRNAYGISHHDDDEECSMHHFTCSLNFRGTQILFAL